MADRVVAALRRYANGQALRHAACVGWTSAYLRDLVCQHHGVTPERSVVFYNGIPDEWIERAGRDLPAWNERPLEIVTVSNVAPYKRQALIIRALPRVMEQLGNRSVVYRVVGDGDPAYLAELKRLAGEVGVAQNVVIEGRVPDERVAEALSRARCFALMSVCESFGIPAIEAMSFGTPVVVSDCCAHPEVCGDAAVLCPPDDEMQLADQLARVLGDAPHAERLREQGRRRVTRFSWSGISRKMAEEIGRLV